MELSESFPPTPEAVRAARHFVQRAVGEAGDDVRESVIMLTSELVTNAVIHARTDLEVTVRCLDDGSVRVDVWDANSRMPQPCHAPLDATTGRGLGIVESLASAWGVERTRDGKTVWFQVSPVRSRVESGR
jgi:anti-sigma regulatory factor (Ser/Thr protein kinase)